eukprot:4003101-Pyramimonas_sp.AAC.1
MCHPHIQRFTAFDPRTAASMTWAYEICLVHLSRELTLLDMELVFRHPCVVDHPNRIQHSGC